MPEGAYLPTQLYALPPPTALTIVGKAVATIVYQDLSKIKIKDMEKSTYLIDGGEKYA